MGKWISDGPVNGGDQVVANTNPRAGTEWVVDGLNAEVSQRD